MAANVEPAPTFTRRVTNAAELQFALQEAITASGIPADEIAFSGVVRMDAEDAGEGPVTATTFHLTIMKRNA